VAGCGGNGLSGRLQGDSQIAHTEIFGGTLSVLDLTDWSGTLVSSDDVETQPDKTKTAMAVKTIAATMFFKIAP
jgi:hypothetical protein